MRSVPRLPTPRYARRRPGRYQIDTAPLSLRHRMSLTPLPSKSPVPAICHAFGTTPADAAICAPPTWPLSDRHRAIVVAPQDVADAIAVEVAGAGDLPCVRYHACRRRDMRAADLAAIRSTPRHCRCATGCR